MANISDLQKKVANCVARQTSGFIRDSDDAFYSFGRLQGGSINAEPVLTEADVAGRDSVLAFDITGTFIMMQTSATEISATGALSIPDSANFPNGHYVFFSDSPTNDPDGDADGTPDVDGFGFANVLLKPTFEIDLGGGESMITYEFSGRVPATAFDNFEADPIITIDA